MSSRKYGFDRRTTCKGRAFILPDGGVSDVEVVIQDDNGELSGTLFDGGAIQRFRALDPDAGDYVIDTTNGTLRLSEGLRNDAIVAIYYETPSGAVGSPANGRNALAALEPPGTDAATAPTTGRVDFDFRITGLYGFAGIDPAYASADYDGADFRLGLSDDRAFLVLRAPGLWTPFEAANLYALPDGAGEDFRYRLVRRNSGATVESDIRLQRIPGTSLLRATQDDASVRSLGYQYPWAEEAPRVTNARIYGPRDQRRAGSHRERDISSLWDPSRYDPSHWGRSPRVRGYHLGWKAYPRRDGELRYR